LGFGLPPSFAQRSVSVSVTLAGFGASACPRRTCSVVGGEASVDQAVPHRQQ
jgi:hypothetical protein